MNPHIVEIIFQVVVFLFAISVHESAHAYVAWRCGDPTARMLGRVTLNPIKHIDPFGTILFPLFAIYMGFPVFGWAKPTPVNSRNFKNVVQSDILTSVAGPASNLLVAVAAVAALLVISLTSGNGRFIVSILAQSYGQAMMMMNGSVLVPIAGLLYQLMLINVLLAVFNIIPVPPLDGSHVLRHFLPPSMVRTYDLVGSFAMILLFLIGGRFIMMLMSPFLVFFNSLLTRL